MRRQKKGESFRETFDRHWIENQRTGCWEWQRALNHDGYGRVYDGRQDIGAHRFSWMKNRGPIPAGQQVLHKCDNRRCVNPEHLFLGTHEINHADKVAKGRVYRPVNERNPKAKIRCREVTLIREAAAAGLSQRYLSKKYGISQSSIGRIVRGETWKDTLL